MLFYTRIYLFLTSERNENTPSLLLDNHLFSSSAFKCQLDNEQNLFNCEDGKTKTLKRFVIKELCSMVFYFRR